MTPASMTGRFPDRARANAAVNALLAAGIPAHAISVTESGGGHEGRFLGRIVILIVLWSIPGGAVGAALGALLSVTGIGPQGTTGVMVQVVSWTIIGHLLAGMWAGYGLLADRSRPEIAAGQEPVTVTVNCRTGAEEEAAKRVLGPADSSNSP